MAKVVYLALHGKRFRDQANPGHTENGWRQLEGLAEKISKRQLPISCIVRGTGRRFGEMAKTIKRIMGNKQWPPDICSVFLGTAEAEVEGGVMLGDGTLVAWTDYLGVSNTAAFHAWEFLENLPDQALLCAGRALLRALGFKNAYRPAGLFQINVSEQERTCQEIE